MDICCGDFNPTPLTLPPCVSDTHTRIHMYRKDFNIAVLQEFVRLHKFHGMDLVQALRYVHMYVHMHENINEPQLPKLRTAFKA